MDHSKKTKILPALKISPELHETITRLARQANRKLHDEVRELIELGAQVEATLLRKRQDAIQELSQPAAQKKTLKRPARAS